MSKILLADSRVPTRRRLWASRGVSVLLVGLFLSSRSGWHEIGGLLPHILTPLGIVLAAIGALGRLWCSSYAAGNKNKLLLVVGPYSLTRNPLYLFSFIGGLGIAITTETLVIPLAFTVWFIAYYRGVVAGEERHLRDVYGSSFDEYRVAVPRFLPSHAGFNEPSRWDMSPPSFRRTLTQVIWFVIAAIVVHAVHDLRMAFAMPALFTLY